MVQPHIENNQLTTKLVVIFEKFVKIDIDTTRKSVGFLYFP